VKVKGKSARLIKLFFRFLPYQTSHQMASKSVTMDEETINPQPPTGTKRDQDSDTPSPNAKTKNSPQPKRVKTGGNGDKEIEIDGE
jgi:hypothetical protein